MFKIRQNKSQPIDTLIAVETRINGDVEFAGGLRLDGYITGDVRGEKQPDSVLSVSEHGSIEGSVYVANIVLNGLVKGDIDATGRVELGEKARVLGSVRYSVIETAVGAQINGKLMHRGAPDSGETPAEHGE